MSWVHCKSIWTNILGVHWRMIYKHLAKSAYARVHPIFFFKKCIANNRFSNAQSTNRQQPWVTPPVMCIHTALVSLQQSRLGEAQGPPLLERLLTWFHSICSVASRRATRLWVLSGSAQKTAISSQERGGTRLKPSGTSTDYAAHAHACLSWIDRFASAVSLLFSQ